MLLFFKEKSVSVSGHLPTRTIPTECTTVAPATIAPMVAPNVKHKPNPNPNPNLNPYHTPK